MATIVVCGDVLRRPRGSNLATHLHYLIGLRKLGHRVIYLEDRGFGTGSPGSGVPRAGLLLLRDLLRRCRVEVPVVWVDPDAGLVGGMVWPQLRRRLAKADLLLDLGGHGWLEERSLPRRRVLIDLDAGASVATLGEPTRQLEHDLYFSYRRDPAGLPEADWQATIPPVVPRLWYGPASTVALPLRVSADLEEAAPGAGDASLGEISSGQLLALRGRISPRPWTALRSSQAPLAEQLRHAGWSVHERSAVDASLSSHRSKIIGSQALLSLHGYRAPSRAIWFTAEGACYLAAGRPVIAADRALESWLPTGTGLLTFSELDGAVAAVELLQRELPLHAAAARSIAERVFHYRVVLSSLLEQALPGQLQAAA